MSAAVNNPPPLHVVGLGAQRQPLLSDDAREAIEHAQVIFGSERQVHKIKSLLSQDVILRKYPRPFDGLLGDLDQLSGYRVVCLASGDPLFFGIGQFLQRERPHLPLIFHGNISSVQSACVRLGLPWQHIKTISVHGRPIETIDESKEGPELLAFLTDSQRSPQDIARYLIVDKSWADAQVWVCTCLGEDNESISTYTLAQLTEVSEAFAQPNVLIVQRGSKARPAERHWPGIADSRFETGKGDGHGLITKQSVRVAALAQLDAAGQRIAWDVGAGCGSIAIEWALLEPQVHVYAIENHSDRFQWLTQNVHDFGLNSRVTAVNKKAPDALIALPDPNRIFVGGGGKDLHAILEACWSRLLIEGVMVITTVTEEAKQAVQQFIKQLGDDEIELNVQEVSVSHAQKLSSFTVMRPALPVSIWTFIKASEVA